MAKRHVESKLVTWTFEESAAGLGWAVFIHVAGASTRLSPWAPSTAELVEALKHITGLAPTATPASETPDTHETPDAPA